ncbi:DUF488 family protein [Nocardia aurantiaca]
MSKQQAAMDEWTEDAPSSRELRKWYHATPQTRRVEFKRE